MSETQKTFASPSESLGSSVTINGASITRSDRELFHEIQERLEINRSQFYQLQPLVLAARLHAVIYPSVACVIAISLIAAVYVFVSPGRIQVPAALWALLPAVCVFLAYGLIQAGKLAIQAIVTASELRFLYAQQKQVIADAETFLQDFEISPESENVHPTRQVMLEGSL